MGTRPVRRAREYRKGLAPRKLSVTVRVPGKKRSRAFAAVVLAPTLASVVLMLAAPAPTLLAAQVAPMAEATPLTPQTCNTECQRRFTDCLQSCDGNQPCMRQCISIVEQCVTRCIPPIPPPPSGAPSSSSGVPFTPPAPTAN